MKGVLEFYVAVAGFSAVGCVLGNMRRGNSGTSFVPAVLASVFWPFTLPMALDSFLTGTSWNISISRTVPSVDGNEKTKTKHSLVMDGEEKK